MTAVTAYFLTSVIVVMFLLNIGPLLIKLDPPAWIGVPLLAILIGAIVSIPVSLILMVWSNVKCQK